MSEEVSKWFFLALRDSNTLEVVNLSLSSREPASVGLNVSPVIGVPRSKLLAD
jgi:hypothetical protein